MLDAMQTYDTTLWLAIHKVKQGDTTFDKSASSADDIVITKLNEIAEYAEQRGVKIALYPHAGFWLERVDDAHRIAEKLN